MGEKTGSRTAREQLTEANIEVLQQLEGLVKKLTDKQYTTAQEEAFNASLGQHVRHIVEFYLCLFAGLEKGEINYDARKRDKEIEENKVYALGKIEEITRKLRQSDFNGDLLLTSEVSTSGDEEARLATNFERELLYTLEHAIHHMAIIKIIVNLKYSGVALMKNFGVAFSTIRFQQSKQRN